MPSSLRGILLVVGFILPILKLFGLSFLAKVSWPLTFTPLIVWAVLFTAQLLIIMGVFGAAVGVLTLSTKQRVR